MAYTTSFEKPTNTEQTIPVVKPDHTKYTPSKTDGIFAIVCFILSYLYVIWIFPFYTALSTTLFILLFLIFGIFYGKVCGLPQTKKSIPYMILLFVGAIRFILFDNDFPAVMLFLFVSLIAVYWVSVFSLNRIQTNEKKQQFSSLFVFDLCNQLFIITFSNFGSAFESIRRLFGKGKNNKIFAQVMIGILICIPIGFVVIQLLCSADIAFHNLLNFLFDILFSNIYISVIKVFLAIPICCYLFGLFYGNFRNRTFHGITTNQIEAIRTGIQKMPKATAYTILTILNLVYILFFVSQSAYLFSGFSNLLPSGFTYAQYAREGFFQLCVIAWINFIIVWLSFLIVETNTINKRSKALTIELILLCVFTLLLIATALSKMVMYINFYGFTQLRLYAAWFMALLWILFILIMAKCIFQIHISKAAFIVFCISFFALCFSNIDGIMAKYNTTRFEKGTLSTFDTSDYKNLSAGAVPYLYEFYQHISEDGVYIGTIAFETGNTNKGIMAMRPEELVQLKTELESILKKENSSQTWYNGDWKTFNMQDYYAQKLIFGSEK